MALSTAQLSALRALNERGEQPAHRTGTALWKRNLVTVTQTGEQEASGDPDGIFVLTSRGKRFIEDYVAKTGDGPEDLKALLRF